MENFNTIEVNGQTINSFLDVLKEDQEMITEFLSKNNIKNLKPDDWYLMTDWLKAFKMLGDEIGEKTLFMVGKGILDNAKMPPNITEIHSSLALINVAYHMNHRLDGTVMFDESNGQMLQGIGNYEYTKTSENSGTMVVDNPYPCEFDRGVITAMARKFKPLAQVILDPIKQNKKEGSMSSTYLISW